MGSHELRENGIKARSRIKNVDNNAKKPAFGVNIIDILLCVFIQKGILSLYFRAFNFA